MVAFPAPFQLPLAAYGAGLLPEAAYGGAWCRRVSRGAGAVECDALWRSYAYGGGFPGLAFVAVVVTGFVPGHPAGFIRGAVGRPFVGIGHGAARVFVFCRGAATAVGPVHY